MNAHEESLTETEVYPAIVAAANRITTGSWQGISSSEWCCERIHVGAITGFILGGITSDVCFVAGTAVLTADGLTAIENIEPEDDVWAWDEETGEIGLRKVKETYVNKTEKLVHIFVNDEEIITTPNHPFFHPHRGWTEAIDLRAGDILVLVNGEYVIVEKIQHEILERPLEVYNFQVEEYHTYYVSDSSVLVHNACSQRASMREAKRSVNIPMSELPTKVEYIPMTGANGRNVFAKLEIYGNKYIRNDIGGHLFYDGTTMARHYNAGIVVGTKLISNKFYFFY